MAEKDLPKSFPNFPRCQWHLSKRAKIILGIALAVLFLAGGVGMGYRLMSKDSRGTKEAVKKLKGEQAKQTVSPEPQDGDALLQAACQAATNDYPEWVTKTSIVVWQNANGTMFFRRSPTDLSVEITTPTGGGERLGALELVDENTIAYAAVSDSPLQKIGLRELDSGTTTILKSLEASAIYDLSFINESEFLILAQEQEMLTLRYINNSSGIEEILFQRQSAFQSPAEGKASTPKIAASPQATYAYLADTAIRIFDLATKKQIAEIEDGANPLWIDNRHLLYSDSTKGGVFLDDVEGGKSYKVSLIDPDATNFSFNPQSGGVLAYHTGQKSGSPQVSAIRCPTGEKINSHPQAILEGLTDQETAIIISNASSPTGGLAAGQSGFWQFVDKSWEVKLSDGLASYFRPLVATAWNRY